MTIRKTTIPQPAIVAADGTEPLTPEQIVEQLRILRQHIPDYGPLTQADAQVRRRAAHVHIDLINAATNSVGASRYLAGAIGKEADDLRDDQADVTRWSAVEHELQKMYKGVAAANLSRRYRLGITSLQAYSIARQLVRQNEHAELLPHVENMRRASKFGRRRGAPVPEESAPPAQS
jgi:hypothetical protein